MLIGARGEGIKSIRDRFNQVQITFPDQGKKSEVVTLRGPKNDVDKCYQHLNKLAQELVSLNYIVIYSNTCLKQPSEGTD